jgi:hypothetical protein
MDLKAYYQRAVLLPVALPLALLPLLSIVPLLPGPAALAFAVLLGSLLVGGLPYLLFLTFFLQWMLDQPEASVRRAVLLAPLRYTSILSAFAFLVIMGVGATSHDTFRLLLTASAASVVVGYGYVALFELGRAALVRRGVVRPTPALLPLDSAAPGGIAT